MQVAVIDPITKKLIADEGKVMVRMKDNRELQRAEAIIIIKGAYEDEWFEEDQPHVEEYLDTSRIG